MNASRDRTEPTAPEPGRAAVICGAGGWLPPRVVTNADLARRLDTSDEWITTRTGIRSRHLVTPGMSTGDLAAAAAELALKSAGLALEPAGMAPKPAGRTAVDAVVLATTTPDHPCPATAPAVAARLGLAGVAAFDLAAVCSGFVYGLASAAGLIAAGQAGRVLLIGAETYSAIVDPADRSTAVIFADGAGAVVLRAGRADEPGAVGPCVLGSDGRGQALIQVAGGGARQRSSGEAARPGEQYLRMSGTEVYRQAVARLAECSAGALARAHWRADQVDRFAPHQANLRICNAVAGRLGIPAGRRLSNIDVAGNTAAASIPLLLAQSAADGRLRAGHRVLTAAFGGGLTWGAATFTWPRLTALVGDGSG